MLKFNMPSQPKKYRTLAILLPYVTESKTGKQPRTDLKR